MIAPFCPTALRPACSGDQGAAERVAELEAALRAAEQDVGEAEAMAQEAMEMAEASQVGGRVCVCVCVGGEGQAAGCSTQEGRAAVSAHSS